MDKKELEDHNLEIQQRFLNHQPGARQKSTKPEKLKSETVKITDHFKIKKGPISGRRRHNIDPITKPANNYIKPPRQNFRH